MSILGQSDVPASTNTSVATMAAAATVNVLLANRTANAIAVSIAVVPSGTGSPANQHWIVYQQPLDGNQMLEKGGIPLLTGDQVFVYTGAVGISASVIGLMI
jgi:hypothetical protein